MTSDPSGLAPVIARLEEFVARARVFSTLEADRASIETLIAQVKKKQAQLQSPLRVLLLGGTGVGKSTLLNALAGSDIARVGVTRPTTREVTAYFHEATGSASLGPLEATAKLVPHKRALLREKVIIDAPDFDSTVAENRALLERALETSDLALVVVTGEKYLAGELFALLARFKDSVAFVFVVNKLDRLGKEAAEVVRDLRGELVRGGLGEARVLTISALAAREAQKASGEKPDEDAGPPPAPADAGELDALRALLERELDRVRIREIKAAKLQDRVRALLERVDAAVPEDSPARVESWRSAWRTALQDLTADLTRSFFGALRSDFEVRNVLRYLFGTAFTGPFGIFMTLVYGVRAMLQPGFGRARGFSARDLEQLLGERLRAIDPAQVERRVALVLERFEDEGRRRGFTPPSLAAPAPARFERDGLPADTAALVAAVRAESARRFYEVFEDTAGGGRRGARIGRFAWNVLPIFVLVFAVALPFRGVLAGIVRAIVAGRWQEIFSTLPSLDSLAPEQMIAMLPSYAEGVLVAFLAMCLLEWPLAERVIERRVAQAFELLEGVVGRAVDACLGEAVLARPESVLEEVEERFQELDRLRRDAKKVIGAPVTVAPPKPLAPPVPAVEPPSKPAAKAKTKA